MAEEMIPVNILLGDRTYRIKTSRNDEEIVRKTVKLINDKIIEFKTNFSGKDMQDYIAMVIIWYATQNANLDNPSVLIEQLTERLSKIEAQLDKAL
ncbi:MAG: cell division protein ZapA [Sphingobacteriales bacterium]|jgi:cell division protein ZapA|nr:cell division protein ZapA [Sphingobacteriales bacterium]